MIELTAEFAERYANGSTAEQRTFSLLMTPSQRMALGPMLFDRECMMIEALIRRQFPEATDTVVHDLLRECVDRLCHNG